ncbi:Gp138 family membrane-puncturing spike protein [Pseudodesulfovibrio pelocollis]|uniref:Gp138 family membrane-puncturing spike protein n=1 Tax=Pseudodesulfovibrio pelocollis TaxID=3051432 RepID=UPI00255A789F|nr:Gp138 family membrane-puncturing spike protein [Pseudodesulfovibrio sp. SB368]
MMDRRERFDDPVEATRAAMDGRMAEVWTALPGVVVAFDPAAMTVSVQPSIKGRVERPDGSATSVALPVLVDVPVVFPSGGGFTMTFPIAPGDDCLVVFAARCIDAWWQSGGVQEPMEPRMHDLSDGFALVGPFSQPRTLPAVSAQNVQLRTNDGLASVTIMPDYTITAYNPAASITLTPDGEINAEADARILLRAPHLEIAANAITLAGLDGSGAAATITGDITLDGSLTSTGDQVAEGVSQVHHVHTGVQAGSDTTGEPA